MGRLWNRMVQRGEDAGQAMLIVLAAITLLGTIPVIIVTTTLNQARLTTYDTNYQAAFVAAQTGLNDYLQRLDTTPDYVWMTDSTNAAFTGWVSVPGATTNPPESYRYTVLTGSQNTLTNSAAELIVSGRAGSTNSYVIRSFEYGVRATSSLDDVYFTNYEVSGQAGCTGEYSWQLSVGFSSCIVEFASGDSLVGNMHTNDIFTICPGASFNGVVTAAVNNDTTPPGPWRTGTSCTQSSGSPSFTPSTSNPSMSQNVLLPTSASDLATDAQKSGNCYYTGPTTITFNSNGTMSVASPLSASNATCGAGTSAAQTVAIPSNGLVYVDNYSGACTSSNAPYYYTLSAFSGGTQVSPEQCTSGDAIVRGTVKGRVTVATANNVIVDGNLVYAGDTLNNGVYTVNASDSTDLLGLIAKNYVMIAHPAQDSSCTSGGATPPLCTNQNVTVDGAVAAYNGSWIVDQWDAGSQMGTLTLNGSLCEDYRGPVGTTGGTGYLKSYNYDSRLGSMWPPYFLAPANAAWYPTSFAEIKPQYTS